MNLPQSKSLTLKCNVIGNVEDFGPYDLYITIETNPATNEAEHFVIKNAEILEISDEDETTKLVTFGFVVDGNSLDKLIEDYSSSDTVYNMFVEEDSTGIFLYWRDPKIKWPDIINCGDFIKRENKKNMRMLQKIFTRHITIDISGFDNVSGTSNGAPYMGVLSQMMEYDHDSYIYFHTNEREDKLIGKFIIDSVSMNDYKKTASGYIIYRSEDEAIVSELLELIKSDNYKVFADLFTSSLFIRRIDLPIKYPIIKYKLESIELPAATDRLIYSLIKLDCIRYLKCKLSDIPEYTSINVTNDINKITERMKKSGNAIPVIVRNENSYDIVGKACELSAYSMPDTMEFGILFKCILFENAVIDGFGLFKDMIASKTGEDDILKDTYVEIVAHVYEEGAGYKLDMFDGKLGDILGICIDLSC